MRNAFRTFCVLSIVSSFSMAISAQTINWQSANGNTTTNDNVGIGTSAPATSLHVATESTAQPRGLMVQQAAESTSSAFVVLRKSRGTLLVPTVVQSADVLGTIYSEGYDGSSFIRSGATIKFTA